MAYNSFFYLVLFLVPVWLAWALLPQRLRPPALLAGSLVFYIISARQYVLWLLFTAAAAHWAARRMAAIEAEPLPDDKAERRAAKAQKTARKRRAAGCAAGAALGLLLVLKYLPFAARAANALLSRLPGALCLPVPGWAAPLGLSFFSLMAVGYVADVYRGACAPAAHYWQVLLFLSFWPHIVEGPFDRWAALSPALLDPPRPSYRAFCFGAQRIAWGMAKKIVIADRANMYVKAVFDDWTQYSGLAVAAATLLYVLQLYAEFSGCMDIVCGSAELFGVPLAENFRQPFFARSVGEFWRRWHITLGAWLREYLFQPLVMSKPLRRFGKACRARFGAEAGRRWPVWLALLVTWAATGLWHGPAWLYLAYGLYYFLLQWLGEACEPLFLRLFPALPRWRERRTLRLWQTARTFVLVCFGMLLFRANGLAAALAMVQSLARPYAGSLLIRLDGKDIGVLLAGAAVLLAVDILHERGVSLRARIAGWALPLRWSVYLALVLVTLLFGAYGLNYDPAGFIYAQF